VRAPDFEVPSWARPNSEFDTISSLSINTTRNTKDNRMRVLPLPRSWLPPAVAARSGRASGRAPRPAWTPPQKGTRCILARGHRPAARVPDGGVHEYVEAGRRRRGRTRGGSNNMLSSGGRQTYPPVNPLSLRTAWARHGELCHGRCLFATKKTMSRFSLRTMRRAN
jgi:hypothetical protein